ncbi:DUF443 family protein [Staphylococcus argenteus]|uniref:DUF443 family protein n=1 Tax=Staphylococcus argenteus TaxID=985002 RepID=UPI000501CDD0|nr:DUF443 family protein [Staphylococcus argenteus]API78624.1 hypothetical protein A7971_02730 [Staphylococcus argenteus]MBE2123605.1 DUF443 family protein [Staphylococcus argenteus]MBE2142662.1 DUF443 family protein [Staphylococcus argenteus]MCG6477656.1 DUF443 domain-containing protein [Staphylococcus argenteus]MCG9816209.1 DUF443 domain-containing protein [Staphylococcus argenteus]
MHCETEIINKNPKYRVIKYDDEYLMVDVVSTWLVYFFPFINWFIPKRCAKISRKEYEKLNTVKPVKNKAFWPVAGGTILLGVTSRKYIHLLNIQLEKRSVIIICFVVFLCILIFFVLLNRKLKLKVFDNKKEEQKIILVPTLKNAVLILYGYLLIGGMSILALSMLLTLENQNLITFIAWGIGLMLFFLMNITLIVNKKAKVIKT